MKSHDNLYNFLRFSASFTLSDFYLSEVSFSENCLQSKVLSRDVPDAIRQSIPCCVRLKLRTIRLMPKGRWFKQIVLFVCLSFYLSICIYSYPSICLSAYLSLSFYLGQIHAVRFCQKKLIVLRLSSLVQRPDNSGRGLFVSGSRGRAVQTGFGSALGIWKVLKRKKKQFKTRFN